jgi:RNA polymerase sigma-70 factor (ECF subfamily)
MSGEQRQNMQRAFLDATLPYLDVVYRVALRCTADRWAAEDLVQETYLRAFAHFQQRRAPDARAWLAAICLNLARSEARRRRSRPEEQLQWEVPEAFSGPDEVADRAVAALDRRELAHALARLPEEQRLCILLMDVGGYTAQETGRILGCPRGTVLARVHRGRRRLAQLLTGTAADRGADHGSA